MWSPTTLECSSCPLFNFKFDGIFSSVMKHLLTKLVVVKSPTFVRFLMVTWVSLTNKLRFVSPLQLSSNTILYILKDRNWSEMPSIALPKFLSRPIRNLYQNLATECLKASIDCSLPFKSPFGVVVHPEQIILLGALHNRNIHSAQVLTYAIAWVSKVGITSSTSGFGWSD